MSSRASSKVILWITTIVTVVLLGIYSLRTLVLQTELFPIFPQDLPAVKGLKLLQGNFSSSQDVFIVLDDQDPRFAEGLDRLKISFSKNPEVASVKMLGSYDPEFLTKVIVWKIVHLPLEKRNAFLNQLQPGILETSLERELRKLSGAVDSTHLMRFKIDPFGLLQWLEINAGVDSPMKSMTDIGRMDSQKPSILVINSKKPLKNFNDCQSFIKNLRMVIKEAGWDKQKVFITGGPAFVAETSIQMERDMYRMFAIAVILVCVAFLVFYRSFVPLIVILLVQVIALLFGLILARLIFKELNVLSMAFGVILLGVSMDYCILVYHYFATAHVYDDWKVLRRGIWFSSVTTAASFCILAFSSFPGLRQLSLLVGAGLLSTAILSTELLPLLFRKLTFKTPVWLNRFSDHLAEVCSSRRWLLKTLFTGLIVVSAGLLGFAHFKYFDRRLDKLQPQNSEAYSGMQKVMAASGSKAEPLSLIIKGDSWTGIHEKIGVLKENLPGLDPKSLIFIPSTEPSESMQGNFEIPSPELIEGFLKKHHINPRSGGFTISVLLNLEKWKRNQLDLAEIDHLSKAVSFSDGSNRFAVIKVSLPNESETERAWDKARGLVSGALPANWNLMAKELNSRVLDDFKKLSIWMASAVLLLCWLAHRSVRLVALNVLALVGALLGFLLLLWITGQSMTILSLLSIPLLIGLIIDYSIHILFGLEAGKGDLKITYRHLAIPVILTGLTSLIGFGSPIASTQPSLQNFGMVMDLGIVAAVVSGLIFMPSFYRYGHESGARSQHPPSIYTSNSYGLALWFVRFIGRTRGRMIGSFLGKLYAWTHPRRVEIVRSNISLTQKEPIDRGRAIKVFENYGAALADYFALGVITPQQAFHWTDECLGFEKLKAIHEQKKGAVLVTLHMGLFEYGNIIMNHFQYPTTVLTRPEPTKSLTDWRAEYRKRWNSDTVQVGEDTFGYLHVFQELKKNRIVTALIDRPLSDHKLDVVLANGRIPFSVGPIVLAIAAKCPVIPAIVLSDSQGRYRSQIFEPFTPEWKPEGREATLQHYVDELSRVFIPLLCKHSDQWYQFVKLS